jgi:hypothetical protein
LVRDAQRLLTATIGDTGDLNAGELLQLRNVVGTRVRSGADYADTDRFVVHEAPLV